MKKPAGYMVVWDDKDMIYVPYGADPECEGGLQSNSDAPLIFGSRAEAKRAISISTHNAKLRKAQGLESNEDFTGSESSKYIRIVPLIPA